jgi:phospholipid/cholesterol/gamma-HCH transport system substrate-binding protein
MQKNILETLMGAVVLIVAGAFLLFAYEGSQMKVEAGYLVSGTFGNASGISLGTDVRIGGIKVGVVSGLDLDPNTYEAVVTMQVRHQTKLPKDSSAAIVSNGLLGEKFIQITPGADDKMLAPGGKLQFTQSAISLEELIGKFMFSGGGVDKGGSGADKGAAGAGIETPGEPAPAAAPAMDDKGGAGAVKKGNGKKPAASTAGAPTIQ